MGLKVIELFSGIGAQTQALKNLGIEHEVIGVSEIDKYAVASYEAIHGKTHNFGDITKIKNLPYCDLLTYSFPCTDISIAGKQEGLSKGSGTRSGLLWEVERLLENMEVKPKYLLLENVKNLVGKKHKEDFDKWLLRLEELGYKNYWKIINSKEYIAQNRERVFVVSIRKDVENSFTFDKVKKGNNTLKLKDLLLSEVDEKYYLDDNKVKSLIDKVKENKKGSLPNFENDNPLITSALSSREHRGQGWKEVAGTLCARDYKDPKVVAEIIKYDFALPVKVRKYEVEVEKLKELLKNHKNITNKEISERLNKPMTLVEHWFRKDNCFSIPEADIWFKLKELLGIQTDYFDKQVTEFEEREGVYEKSNRFYDENGIAPTLTSTSADEKIICEQRSDEGLRFFKDEVCGTLRTIDSCGDKRVLESSELKFIGGIDSNLRLNDGKNLSRNYKEGYRVYDSEGLACTQKSNGGGLGGCTGLYEINYRIRKLTPNECFRLMGFSDEQFHKAEKVCSNSQLYKQSGNSIVIPVLEAIFKELFENENN